MIRELLLACFAVLGLAGISAVITMPVLYWRAGAEERREQETGHATDTR